MAKIGKRLNSWWLQDLGHRLDLTLKSSFWKANLLRLDHSTICS